MAHAIRIFQMPEKLLVLVANWLSGESRRRVPFVNSRIGPFATTGGGNCAVAVELHVSRHHQDRFACRTCAGSWWRSRPLSMTSPDERFAGGDEPRFS